MIWFDKKQLGIIELALITYVHLLEHLREGTHSAIIEEQSKITTETLAAVRRAHVPPDPPQAREFQPNNRRRGRK